MSYFDNFPSVEYLFGSNGAVLGQQVFQNLNVYVDVIDQYKDSIGTFSYYNVLEGERADILSQRFYGRPDLHWTFWLLNDHIRESGWVLTRIELDAKMEEEYSNRVIATRTDIYGSVIEGTNNTGPLLEDGATLTGSQSGTVAIVDYVEPNTGQVFLTSGAVFTAGEAATWIDSNGILQTLVVESCVLGYNAVDHYEDSNGEEVDIDPTSGPGALINEVTVKDMYSRRNEELRQIKFIQPKYIEQIVDTFNAALED